MLYVISTKKKKMLKRKREDIEKKKMFWNLWLDIKYDKFTLELTRNIVILKK